MIFGNTCGEPVPLHTPPRRACLPLPPSLARGATLCGYRRVLRQPLHRVCERSFPRLQPSRLPPLAKRHATERYRHQRGACARASHTSTPTARNSAMICVQAFDASSRPHFNSTSSGLGKADFPDADDGMSASASVIAASVRVCAASAVTLDHHANAARREVSVWRMTDPAMLVSIRLDDGDACLWPDKETQERRRTHASTGHATPALSGTGGLV